MKVGKRYSECLKAYDKNKLYEVEEGIDAVLATSKAKFDETVEFHVRLGVDPKQADQQVRGVIVLPHGTGKSVKVLVIAKGEKADAATAVGADYVGAEDMVQKIQKENWFDFDVVITTPDIAKAVKDVKAGKVEYRLDKTAVIHCIIGKKSFGKEKLLENYRALLDAIIKAKPAAAKGVYVKSIALASTMGPGVKINTKTL